MRKKTSSGLIKQGGLLMCANCDNRQNTSPVLTICVPSYNMQQHLPNLLDRFQSDILDSFVFEVLVINDGSTDKTRAIAEEYCSKKPDRFRCINKENGHYGSAVNRGIAEAKGTFFKIVDADDLVDPLGFAQMLTVLQKNPSLDLLITDFQWVNYQSEVLNNVKYKYREHEIFYLSEELPDPVAMHAIAYKTSLLAKNKIRLDEGVLYTDVEFALFPIPYVQTAYYLPEVVYQYVIGREGQSMDRSLYGKTMTQHRMVLDHLLSWYQAEIQDSQLPDNICTYIEMRIGSMCCHHASRCFLASNSSNSYKKELLSLEHEIQAYPEIAKFYEDKSLRLLRATRYHTYGFVAAVRKYKVNREKA